MKNQTQNQNQKKAKTITPHRMRDLGMPQGPAGQANRGGGEDWRDGNGY